MQDENPFENKGSEERLSTDAEPLPVLRWSNGKLEIRADISITTILSSLLLTLLAILLPACLLSWHLSHQTSTPFVETFSGFFSDRIGLLSLALTQLESLTILSCAIVCISGRFSLVSRSIVTFTLLLIHAIGSAILMYIRFEGGLPLLFGLFPWANFI